MSGLAAITDTTRTSPNVRNVPVGDIRESSTARVGRARVDRRHADLRGRASVATAFSDFGNRFCLSYANGQIGHAYGPFFHLGTLIMTWSAQYRSEAAECMAAARATEHHNNKALFLMMADAWIRLADQVEARARPSTVSLNPLKRSFEPANSLTRVSKGHELSKAHASMSLLV
jgi:hypothetical protein